MTEIRQTRMPKSVLTKLQIKVLQLLADGYKQKEIAEILCVRPQTVKNTLARARERAGISGRTLHLLKFAIAKGFVELSS